jgi:plasmid stability protein
MGSITIRGIDDDVKAGLRQRAAARGTSMEAEARAILRAATRLPGTGDIGAAIRSRFQGLDAPTPIAREAGRDLPDFE